MALPLIALAISAAGTAASGIMSANANNKRQAALDKENARQTAYYEAQLNRDPLNEFYNRNIIGTIQRTMKDRLSTLKARQKITGELDTTNMAKDQNAEVLSKVYSNILSNEALRRQNIANNFENAKRNMYQQQADIDYAKMQNYANLANNAANLGAAAIGGIRANGKPLKGWAKREQHIADEFGDWQGYYDHLKNGGNKVSNNPNDWQ